MTLLDCSKVVERVDFCESLNCVYTWSTMHVYTRVHFWSPKSITLERDWKQHDRYAAYVIAQQYSSATCLSLRFHTGRKLSACLCGILLFQVILF